MEELKAKFKKEFEEMKESLLDLEVDREEELKGREEDYQKRLDEFNEKYSGEVFPTDIPKRDELVKKAEKYEKPKEKLEEELKRQKEGLKVWEEKGIKDQLYNRRKDVVIPKIEKQIEELNKQIEDEGIKTEWVELGKIKSQLKDLPLHTKDSIMEELNDISWFMEEPKLEQKPEIKRGSNVYNLNDLKNMSKGANPHPFEMQPEQEPVDVGVLSDMVRPYAYDSTPEPEEAQEVPFAYPMGEATPEPEERHGVTEQDKILNQVREKIEMLIPVFDKQGGKSDLTLEYSLDAEGVNLNGKKYTFEELSEFEDKNELEEKIKANLEPKDEKKLSENLDDYIFKAMAKQCEDKINKMIANTASAIKDNPELKDEIGQMYKDAAKDLIKNEYGTKIKALKEGIVDGKKATDNHVKLSYNLRHMSVFSRMARRCILEKAEINRLTETVYNLKDNENVTIKVGPLTKIKFAIRDKLKDIKREKLTDGSENRQGMKAKVKDSYDKVVDRYTENRLYDGSKYPGGAKKAEAEVKGNKPDEFRKKFVSGKRGTTSSKLASKGSIKREQSGKGER